MWDGCDVYQRSRTTSGQNAKSFHAEIPNQPQPPTALPVDSVSVPHLALACHEQLLPRC